MKTQKLGNVPAPRRKAGARQGYWLYGDGLSCWGTNLWRNGELGVRDAVRHGDKVEEEKR